MIDSGSFVYRRAIGIKAKDPPWFANLTGSAADSVAAKVRLLFDLCKSLGRKIVQGERKINKLVYLFFRAAANFM